MYFKNETQNITFGIKNKTKHKRQNTEKKQLDWYVKRYVWLFSNSLVR